MGDSKRLPDRDTALTAFLVTESKLELGAKKKGFSNLSLKHQFSQESEHYYRIAMLFIFFNLIAFVLNITSFNEQRLAPVTTEKVNLEKPEALPPWKPGPTSVVSLLVEKKEENLSDRALTSRLSIEAISGHFLAV